MNSCDLQAVLVSTDSVVVDSVSQSLEKLGITPAVYRDAPAAVKTLNSQKTDAFLVDRELDPELSVLKAMRHSTSSRFAVAFAICSQESPARGAFRVADFVIDKPLASHRVNRTMKAAYGIMLKERMRYFRIACAQKRLWSTRATGDSSRKPATSARPGLRSNASLR